MGYLFFTVILEVLFTLGRPLRVYFIVFLNFLIVLMSTFGVGVHFLYLCWPAPPDDPQGIRVASAIEFSVCLSVCSLFSVLLKFSNLFILQERAPKAGPCHLLIFIFRTFRCVECNVLRQVTIELHSM